MIATVIVIMAIVWVIGSHRREKAVLEAAAKRIMEVEKTTLTKVCVVTITFTDGPVEQWFYSEPQRAMQYLEQVNPGTYAGDGRRVVTSTVYHPFA